jgi:hypothetical protein
MSSPRGVLRPTASGLDVIVRRSIRQWLSGMKGVLLPPGGANKRMSIPKEVTKVWLISAAKPAGNAWWIIGYNRV